ncbi:MAG: DUF445 domain-containing protein [Wujia sp.]
MLKYLAGPIIGALIGYCTNYIAVKMLFYPKKEIHLFGHRLPFTPGAIPKGKGRLAKAIGSVVGTTLITREDIEQKIQPDEIGATLADMMMEKLDAPVKGELIELAGIQEETYIEKKELLSRKISEMAVDVLSHLDLSDILAEKGTSIIRDKIKGSMLEMFLTDDLIASVIGPVGAEVQNMIAAQGVDYIAPVVSNKLTELENESALQLLEGIELEQSVIRSALASVCARLVKSGIDKIFDTLDIQAMVEEKINAMSVDDLEDLVFTVMKKELNTIVNLGALIGLVLGVLNIFL